MAHNALLPIHRLPNETLCAIALFTLPEHDAHSARARRHSVAVSHVCALWRDITLSLPALWTNIAYDTDDHEPVNATKSRVEAFLSRSRNALLDFRLMSRITEDEAAFTVINMMRPHWWRCRALQITTPTPLYPRPSAIERLIFPIPGPLPNLVSTKVTNSISFGVLRLFRDDEIPNLVELEVEGNAGTVILPYSSVLRTLVVSLDIALASDPFSTLRRASQSLERLQLNFGSIPPPSTPVELPVLTSFITTLSTLPSLARRIKTKRSHLLAIRSSSVFLACNALEREHNNIPAPIPHISSLRVERRTSAEELSRILDYISNLSIYEIPQDSDTLLFLSNIVRRTGQLPGKLNSGVIRTHVPFRATYPNPYVAKSLSDMLSTCPLLKIEFTKGEGSDANENITGLMKDYPGRLYQMKPQTLAFD